VEYTVIRCKWCRRKIGNFRQLVDREYCSNTHRKLATTASARDLRDARYIYGDDEYSIIDPERRKEQPKSKGSSLGGFAMLGGLIILAMIWMPQGGQDAPIAKERAGYALNSETLWSKFRDGLPSASHPGISLSEDFHSGLTDWVALPRASGSSGSSSPAAYANNPGSSSAWVVQGGVVKPRELRLWAPSMKLKNYNLDFQAQIDQKAIGWAFRAKDFQNYYATKIVLSRPAPFPVSEIVRYTMLNGKEQGRVQLPLPMQLQKGTLYEVRVHIKGDQFITTVNGAVVDAWQDARLKSGGVGFFAEKGEVASIMGVKVAEERGLLERVFLPAVFVSPSAW
jgi:hypothetical protein